MRRRFGSLARTAVLAFAVAAIGAAAAPGKADACDRPPSPRPHLTHVTCVTCVTCDHCPHCEPCRFVPGRHETRWETRWVTVVETRLVFCGWTTEARSAPVTREVYDARTDTYIEKTEYAPTTARVPQYREERVSVRRPERVAVRVWVPGHWLCHAHPHVHPTGCRG